MVDSGTGTAVEDKEGAAADKEEVVENTPLENKELMSSIEEVIVGGIEPEKEEVVEQAELPQTGETSPLLPPLTGETVINTLPTEECIPLATEEEVPLSDVIVTPEDIKEKTVRLVKHSILKGMKKKAKKQKQEKVEEKVTNVVRKLTLDETGFIF